MAHTIIEKVQYPHPGDRHLFRCLGKTVTGEWVVFIENTSHNGHAHGRYFGDDEVAARAEYDKEVEQLAGRRTLMTRAGQEVNA